MDTGFKYTIRSSRFGTFAVLWCEGKDAPVVHRVFLPAESLIESIESEFPGARVGRHAKIVELACRIHDFLRGADVAFSLDHVAMGACSWFQRRVLVAEHSIPRGWVSTYGGLAAHLGTARLARAVGRALATNPFPIIIPCHRAIGAGGLLGGYQGGLAMKRALLEYEGAEFSNSARIIRPRLFYGATHRSRSGVRRTDPHEAANAGRRPRES